LLQLQEEYPVFYSMPGVSEYAAVSCPLEEIKLYLQKCDEIGPEQEWDVERSDALDALGTAQVL
jgi:hypothetical protein